MNVAKKLGIGIPAILLPRPGVDLTKWSVVACDQYTSQPDYWARVEEVVGTAPSTLRLTFPEVYLGQDGAAARITDINQTMDRYLQENVLVPQAPGFVLIDRRTSHAASRKGLLLALDLEAYDFRQGSQTLIRATEGTVLKRLPPRIKIRENAPIELPHIMVLIDDPDHTVIEPLADWREELEQIYDFDLMMGGEHITGYRVTDQGMISGILDALARLADPRVFQAKYGVGPEQGVLLFAMGDGNHSLATAKACWEKLKETLPEEAILDHPARYALVEVVNVHDAGLNFEPIHRVVFHSRPQALLDRFVAYHRQQQQTAYYRQFAAAAELARELPPLQADKNIHVIPFSTGDSYGLVAVEQPRYNLAVGTLQAFLDDFVADHEGVEVDYIHGEDVVRELAAEKGNIGFYLPPMDKGDLFKTVILDGVLPRKTFSMGEAEEKRFYLECRKIK